MDVILGVYEPWVPTGRGSWLPFSKTTLQTLLERFDRAYPTYTDTSREYVIENWRVAEQMVVEGAVS